MNRSKLFLFYIISTSAFSASAMEEGSPQNQKLIRHIPILGRLDRGESPTAVLWDLCTGTLHGLETVRQGYLTARDSSITSAITTGVQTGAGVLATNTYSAGVTLYEATQKLYELAYTERSKDKEKQLTFDEALFVFNTNMPSILDQSQQKECKKNVVESLTIINRDISLITRLINNTKDVTDNNSSGIRTTVIDYVIEKVNSEKNPLAKKEMPDFIGVINAIASSSKNENDEININGSTFERKINDGETLLTQLKEAEMSSANNNVLLDFIQKYMPDNANLNKIREKKNKQNIATVATAQQLKEEQLIAKQLEAERKLEEEQKLAERLAKQLEEEQQKLEEELKLAKQLEAEQLKADQQKLVEQQKLAKQKLEEDRQARNSKYAKIGGGVATFIGIIALLYNYNKLPEALTSALNNVFSAILSNRYYNLAR